MMHPFLTQEAETASTSKKWRQSLESHLEEEAVLRNRMRADFLMQHVRCAILRHERRTVRAMTNCPITKQLLCAMLRQKKYAITASVFPNSQDDHGGAQKPSRCDDGLVTLWRTRVIRHLCRRRWPGPLSPLVSPADRSTSFAAYRVVVASQLV